MFAFISNAAFSFGSYLATLLCGGIIISPVHPVIYHLNENKPVKPVMQHLNENK